MTDNLDNAIKEGLGFFLDLNVPSATQIGHNKARQRTTRGTSAFGPARVGAALLLAAAVVGMVMIGLRSTTVTSSETSTDVAPDVSDRPDNNVLKELPPGCLTKSGAIMSLAPTCTANRSPEASKELAVLVLSGLYPKTDYTVVLIEPDETLLDIAASYDVSVDQINAANGGAAPSTPGRVILVPLGPPSKAATLPATTD